MRHGLRCYGCRFNIGKIRRRLALLAVAVLPIGHFKLPELQASVAQVFNKPCLVGHDDLRGGSCAGVKPDVNMAIASGKRDIKLSKTFGHQRELQVVVAGRMAGDVA